MARRIIVSAADSTYHPLLLELISSIQDAQEIEDVAVGVLDIGLTVEQREALRPRVTHILAPDWDYQITKSLPLKFKAMTARPHLTRYFPGYDLIMWMDADTWVQRGSAVDHFFQQAWNGGLAVCQEMDRSYLGVYNLNNSRLLFFNSLKTFDPALAPRIVVLPMINSGVFAMRSDCPIWSDWSSILGTPIRRGHFDFFTEQTALNICVYNRLPSRPCFMPARFNWLCVHALPSFDEKSLRYVEPALPYDEIQVIHLAGVQTRSTAPVEIMDVHGKETSMNLSYAQWKQLNSGSR
ncbi:MAG: hypothetical protein ACLQF4_02980 [Xanthobacteraceae bacterium]